MTPTFADVGVPDGLCALLARTGFTEPFPIQAATLPDALAGRDICGRAPTGSGKTLAFGLTIATRARPGGSRRPTTLVLVPTRELASQVAGEIEALSGFHGHKVVTLKAYVVHDLEEAVEPAANASGAAVCLRLCTHACRSRGLELGIAMR